VQLSEDQKQAVQRILNWYFSQNRSPYITLGGYAGTGKTTIISVVKLLILKYVKEKKFARNLNQNINPIIDNNLQENYIQGIEQNSALIAEQNFEQVTKQDFEQVTKQNLEQVTKQDLEQVTKQNLEQVTKQDFEQNPNLINPALLDLSPTLQDQSKKPKVFKVAFCSYTGKATLNLKNKLNDFNAVSYKDTVSTIHGLIYKPIENHKQEIVGWMKNETIEYDLIIVDEASMVDQQIWLDLLSYGIPVIAVGDHGQLSPINGDFNLMQNPHVALTKIHRQAKENPIIDVSILARTKGKIPAKEYGLNIVKYSPENFDYAEVSNDLLQNYTLDTLVLCGYNNTRNKINSFIRSSLGFDTKEPCVGDRVICLRNNHTKNIYNGMLGTILEINLIDELFFEAKILMDETEYIYNGKIYAPQFGSTLSTNFTKDRPKIKDADLFDFGYALTVHKAQGSQCKRVVLFEERFAKMDDSEYKKWLYTAVTRAEKELFIFGN